MTKPKSKTKPAPKPEKKELKDEELEGVAGGGEFAPQPEPPKVRLPEIVRPGEFGGIVKR